MSDSKTEVNAFINLENFFKKNNDPALQQDWALVSQSNKKVSQLAMAIKVRNRNIAIKKAAGCFSDSMKPFARATFLLLHLKNFEVDLVDNYSGLSDFDKHLYEIHKTGAKIPQSDVGIYNVIIDKS